MSVFIDNIQAIYRAGREDLKGAPLKDKALFAGTAGFLLAHEFVMESALVYAGTHTYEATQNPLAVSAVLGGMSLATEVSLTIGMSKSIESFDKVTEEVEARYYTSHINTPDKPNRRKKVVGALDTATLAITLGSPGVILRGYAKNPHKTYEENRRTGFQAAAALATLNATVTAGLTGGVGWVAEKFGTESVSNFLVEAGRSPITYGVIGTYVVGRAASVAHQNKKLREQFALDQAAEAPK